MIAAILVATIQIAAMPATSRSPSPAPTPRFDLKASGSNVFIDQATGGRGITPPEGTEFANGSPISPMSPYDWFSSAPVTPGVAGIAQYEISGTYHATGLDFSATARGRRLRSLRDDWKVGAACRRKAIRADGPSIPYGPRSAMRGTAFIVGQKISL